MNERLDSREAIKVFIQEKRINIPQNNYKWYVNSLLYFGDIYLYVIQKLKYICPLLIWDETSDKFFLIAYLTSSTMSKITK